MISLLIIPASAIILILGFEPYWILSFQIFINVLIFVYRLIFANAKTNFPIGYYIQRVIIPCCLQSLLIIPIPLLLLWYSHSIHWIAISIVSFIMSLLVFMLLGIPAEYRRIVMNYIKKIKVNRNDI